MSEQLKSGSVSKEGLALTPDEKSSENESSVRIATIRLVFLYNYENI